MAVHHIAKKCAQAKTGQRVPSEVTGNLEYSIAQFPLTPTPSLGRGNRRRVLRLPEGQLGVVMPQQLGQVTRVLRVVLRPAGDEGLAILLEREGIDGVDREPGVGLQEGNDRPGGLLDTQADLRRGILLAQIRQPVVEGVGLGGDGLGPLLAGAGVEEVQVGLAIGAIQAALRPYSMSCIDSSYSAAV